MNKLDGEDKTKTPEKTGVGSVQRSRSTLKKNTVAGSATLDPTNPSIEPTHKRELTILTASIRKSKDVKLLQ